MSEELRQTIQLIANIGGVGFVVVMGFLQLADYFADYRPRHIAAAIAWFILVPILILRTAGIYDPPLIDRQIITDGAAIGWATTLFVGMIWGVLRMFDKRQETKLRRKLGIEPERNTQE